MNYLMQGATQKGSSDPEGVYDRAYEAEERCFGREPAVYDHVIGTRVHCWMGRSSSE